MRVCIPAGDERGLESRTFGHFGSAPFFVVHDTDEQTTKVIRNENQHHAHGGCQPLLGLGGGELDALVVGGIGRRAIARLNEAGTKVYRAIEGTIADNLASLRAGELDEFAADAACAGHGDH
jgi:predicted Fe-Mo cluster-binding NifX family protein